MSDELRDALRDCRDRWLYDIGDLDSFYELLPENMERLLLRTWNHGFGCGNSYARACRAFGSIPTATDTDGLFTALKDEENDGD